MANTPKKITDPTEAALSAIQDALSARDTPVEAEPVNPSLPPLPPVTSTEEAPSAEEPWRTVQIDFVRQGRPVRNGRGQPCG